MPPPSSEVARHPDDPEVAIAANTSQFFAAARDNNIRAISFNGYSNPELDAYLDSAGSELDRISIRTVLKPEEENLELKEAVHPVLFKALTDMGNLFCQATGHEYARLKILRPETFKPHTHITPDMTYSFGLAGTQWENGQADPRKPFFFKPNFSHNSPPNPRTIAVFEGPEPTLETTKSFKQSFTDFLHTLGL